MAVEVKDVRGNFGDCGDYFIVGIYRNREETSIRVYPEEVDSQPREIKAAIRDFLEKKGK